MTMSDGHNAGTSQMERRVRCSCGFRTGWFDPEDANHIADHHDWECEGDVEYKEREKEGTNYSDFQFDTHYLLTICPHCDDGKDHECRYCGRGFRRSRSRDDHQLVCMAP